MEDNTEEKRFVRWLIILIALIIIATVTAILVFVYCPDEKENITQDRTGMPQTMAFRSAASLSANESDSTVNLTATVYPEVAGDQYLNWSVEFVNASSTWATGKTASDYVSVTPTSEGSVNATVRCLKPFGEQIKITATSRNNEKAKSECTVDFVKQILDTYVEWDRLDASKRKIGTLRFDETDSKIVMPSDTHYIDMPRLTIEYTDYTIGEMDEFDIRFFLKGTEDMYNKLKTVTGKHFVNSFHNIELGYPTSIEPGDYIFATDYNCLTEDPEDIIRVFYYVYESNDANEWRSGISVIKDNTDIPYFYFSVECFGREISFEKEYLVYASPELFTV
ncbi:MAG: hypothetical protein NC184_05325 [Roseburia sp.]|nr:hypothetical protein [Roseburia sp.]